MQTELYVDKWIKFKLRARSDVGVQSKLLRNETYVKLLRVQTEVRIFVASKFLYAAQKSFEKKVLYLPEVPCAMIRLKSPKIKWRQTPIIPPPHPPILPNITWGRQAGINYLYQ